MSKIGLGPDQIPLNALLGKYAQLSELPVTLIKDWNTPEENGLYKSEKSSDPLNTINGPADNVAYMGIVALFGAGGFQLVMKNGEPRMYYRRRQAGSWVPEWTRILDETQIQGPNGEAPVSSILAAGDADIADTLVLMTQDSTNYLISQKLATALNILSGEAGRLVTADGLDAANAIVDLGAGPAFTVDLATGRHFKMLLNGASTLALPTNLLAGRSGTLHLLQGLGNVGTMSFDPGYKFSGGLVPAAPGSAGATQILSYLVLGPTSLAVSEAGVFL